jgi:hypothetical protein
MGFKPVHHRVGAVMFLVFFLLFIAACVFSELQYQMAFIGSIAWIILKYSIDKNKDDKAGRQFDYLKYMDAEYDNLAVNAIGVFIVVPQMGNIVAAINDHVEAVTLTDLWYYAAGILCDGLYILAFKVAELKKKYEGSAKETPPTE